MQAEAAAQAAAQAVDLEAAAAAAAEKEGLSVEAWRAKRPTKRQIRAAWGERDGLYL